LRAVREQIDPAAGGASTATVRYDSKQNGPTNLSSITLQGDAASGGTAIHNVADAVDAHDAVNLGQIAALIDTAIDHASTSDTTSALFSADDPSGTAAAHASGKHAIAAGDRARARGSNSIAIGSNADAIGVGAVALGADANASADNSVALGQGSVADRANSVSIGADGSERQLTHLAAGVSGTDAVNVNQLNRAMTGVLGQANRYTDDKIRSARRDASGGTAAALASAALPQAVMPGRGLVAASAGTYAGQSAMAIGLSQLSDTGIWSYKLHATASTRGEFGAAIGAGVHF
jgi:autotransporter adhesin